MSTNYYPGPWKILKTDIDADGREIDIASEGWVKIGTVHGDKFGIDIIVDDMDYSTDEGKACAELIAKAPEMADRIAELEAERDQYALDGSNWYKRTRELEAENDKLRSQAALNSDYLRHAEAENERLRAAIEEAKTALADALHGEVDGFARLSISYARSSLKRIQALESEARP